MKIIKFRVTIDYKKPVFREIEISSQCTLLDFHNIIQKAFDFDNSQMASFYLSNDKWEKGKEFTLFDMGSNNNNIATMESVKIKDIISKKNEKLLYIFDFLRMWIFYIEAISIFERQNTKSKYIKIVGKSGKAPHQYSKRPEDVNFVEDNDSFDSEIKDISSDFDFAGYDDESLLF